MSSQQTRRAFYEDPGSEDKIAIRTEDGYDCWLVQMRIMGAYELRRPSIFP